MPTVIVSCVARFATYGVVTPSPETCPPKYASPDAWSWRSSSRIETRSCGRASTVSVPDETHSTGQKIGAAEALAWGLVDRIVAETDLLPQAAALATDVLAADPAHAAAIKAMIGGGA